MVDADEFDDEDEDVEEQTGRGDGDAPAASTITVELKCGDAVYSTRGQVERIAVGVAGTPHSNEIPGPGERG